MKTVLAGVVAVFMLHASAHALDKIRIGFAPAASSAPFPLAQKKGFMKEEGLDAEVIRMSSTIAAAALASGEADYVTGISALRGEQFKVCRSKLSPLTSKGARKR